MRSLNGRCGADEAQLSSRGSLNEYNPHYGNDLAAVAKRQSLEARGKQHRSFLPSSTRCGYPSLSNVAVRLREERGNRIRRWLVLPRPRVEVHSEVRGGDANDLRQRKLHTLSPFFVTTSFC